MLSIYFSNVFASMISINKSKLNTVSIIPGNFIVAVFVLYSFIDFRIFLYNFVFLNSSIYKQKKNTYPLTNLTTNKTTGSLNFLCA